MTDLLNVLKTSLAQVKVPVRSTVLPRMEAKDGTALAQAEPDLPDDPNEVNKQLLKAQLEGNRLDAERLALLKMPRYPVYDDDDKIVSVHIGKPIEYDLPDETETDEYEDDDDVDAQYQADLTL